MIFFQTCSRHDQSCGSFVLGRAESESLSSSKAPLSPPPHTSLPPSGPWLPRSQCVSQEELGRDLKGMGVPRKGQGSNGGQERWSGLRLLLSPNHSTLPAHGKSSEATAWWPVEQTANGTGCFDLHRGFFFLVLILLPTLLNWGIFKS